MAKVIWRWDCGVYIPLCPYCNEFAYEHDRCVFCGKPYEMVKGKHRPTYVRKDFYEVVQSTSNNIAIYNNGVCMAHIRCAEKKSESELLELLERFVNEGR